MEGAIHNIRRNLEKREEYQETCQRLDDLRKGLKEAAAITEVMSIEAHARKAYYAEWSSITGWEFEKEHEAATECPQCVNIIWQSMLYTTILKIYHTAINPTISYLHEPSERRFSLALDMAEIFKPVFVIA